MANQLCSFRVYRMRSEAQHPAQTRSRSEKNVALRKLVKHTS